MLLKGLTIQNIIVFNAAGVINGLERAQINTIC